MPDRDHFNDSDLSYCCGRCGAPEACDCVIVADEWPTGVRHAGVEQYMSGEICTTHDCEVRP